MSIRSWLQYVHSSLASVHGIQGGRPRHEVQSEAIQLSLEPLEDRRMLSFSFAGNYDTGFSYSPAIATADFNNDGALDLAATVGSSLPRISVRLGDGAGGFGAAQEFAVGGYDPNSIFVADFNHDTKLDILEAGVGDFNILMGNGDGTFQSAVTTYTGDFPQVALGDFNNDSSIDLVVGWYHWDFGLHYQPYLGNGLGGFAAGTAENIQGAGELAAVELNNDGRLDVALADGRVLLGNGNGTFQFDYNQQFLLNGGAIATGDFTDEENADVVVASDTQLAVLPGRGDGGFHAPIHYSSNGIPHSAVATTDVDGDGKLDAVVADKNAATVSAMLGNGDGTLRFAGAFPTGSSPSSVAIGDFNGDGRPDVAVANADSNNFSVLLNDGNWATVPPPPPTISIGDTTVTEGNAGTNNATFAVTLAGPAAVDVSVRYETQNVTATQLTDYAFTSGTLTISAGQTSGTITVAIHGDRLAEFTESFSVNLSAPTNAAIADGQAIGTIIDNEPRISISDVSKAEGKKGATTLFKFTITLSAAYDQPVTMSYRTVDGTATTAGSDYVAKSGTLTFAPGEITKTITIEVKGDSKRETNEYFYLDLYGNSSNSLFTKSRGIGTILNDDLLRY